jgi:hypothetical protein
MLDDVSIRSITVTVADGAIDGPAVIEDVHALDLDELYSTVRQFDNTVYQLETNSEEPPVLCHLDATTDTFLLQVSDSDFARFTRVVSELSTVLGEVSAEVTVETTVDEGAPYSFEALTAPCERLVTDLGGRAGSIDALTLDIDGTELHLDTNCYGLDGVAFTVQLRYWDAFDDLLSARVVDTLSTDFARLEA